MRKTAIITGGTKGIGFGVTKKLSQEGYQVALMGTTPLEENAEAAGYLDENKIPWIYVRGSIAELTDHERLVDAAVKAYGRVDLLVNNAGVGPLERRDILDMTVESFDRVMSTNLRGTMFLTQRVARRMVTQEEINGYRGIIVSVSSISSTVVSTSRGEYCMSKAGLSMMTELFAARLARDSVFVYEVRPGIIKTRITEVVKDRYDAVCASDELLVKRWGTPEDVAEAVAAFCRNDMRYCTGQSITVDGGFNMRRL